MIFLSLGTSLNILAKSSFERALNSWCATAIIKQSKLVKYRKEGKSVYYSLDDEHVNEILMKGREHIEEVWV